MPDELMMLGYLAPMAAILGLFWKVARQLGAIESELKQVRSENQRLKADLAALRDILFGIVDARRDR
jgi:hypothetical protein